MNNDDAVVLFGIRKVSFSSKEMEKIAFEIKVLWKNLSNFPFSEGCNHYNDDWRKFFDRFGVFDDARDGNLDGF